MQNMTVTRFLIITLFFLCLGACSLPYRGSLPDIPDLRENQGLRSTQALVVTNERFLFFTSHRVYALEMDKDIWRSAMPPMKAAVGKNGFAPPGEKREGDGRTPSGQYFLGTAFGYAPSASTQMPYRQAQSDDLWVDDPQAPDYNRWVKLGKTTAASYEKMKRDDNQYKYGVVIEYNTHPVIPGRGSAIFLHVWKEPGSPTAGCVAVSEEDMLKILGWLNPAAHPLMVINPDKKRK